MLKPKTFGLWANTDKDIFWNILPEIIEWADRKKIQIFATEKIQSNSRYNFTNLLRSMFAVELDNKLKKTSISVSAVHPGVTKSRQSRPYQVKKIRKSFYTYFSTNINTGIAPILQGIEEVNVSSDLVFAPKIFGIYEPAKNNFDLNMWSQTDAEKVRSSFKVN